MVITYFFLEADSKRKGFICQIVVQINFQVVLATTGEICLQNQKRCVVFFLKTIFN